MRTMRNRYRRIAAIGIVLLSLVVMTGVSAEIHGTWWRVCFTDPARRGRLPADNPESALITLIRNARDFCGAFYDVSSERIADALIDAHRRGVSVKIVTEEQNAERDAVKKLCSAGIAVVTDRNSGLMHHKFAVIDDIVWTGSFNITRNGLLRNNNNALAIRSDELASIFRDEFFEMFRDRIFGNRREPPFARLTKRYYVRIGETPINVFFSPEDNIERIIRKRIRKARESVHFMMFSFTSDVLGEEIIRSFQRGVKVYGIFERDGSGSRYSEYVKMKLEGIPVRFDGNKGKMHHKVLILDKKVVITGSYNFTSNANRVNDENILIIDNSSIAAEYLKEFYRLYGRVSD